MKNNERINNSNEEIHAMPEKYIDEAKKNGNQTAWNELCRHR